jgi:nitrous oxidase accessory protein NosD
LRAEKSTVTFNKNSVRQYFRGMLLVNTSTAAGISDNTVTQSQYAIILLGSNANITKNLIIQNKGDGVYIGMPEKQNQTAPQEVTISQNTISQNETAVDAETFNHLTVKENLIEANQWGVRAVHASVSLENNTIVLQKSTAINLGKGADARMYNNIVALNGFGIFAHVESRRESGHNDVFGNLVSTDFPLRDGNYGRSDYYTAHDKRKIPIEVYPAYDMKAPTDLSVDPGFTKVGSDYTLKPGSPLAKIRGEGGRYLGAYAVTAAPARQALAVRRPAKAAAKP